MIEIFSKIFGSKKIIEAGISAADKSVFTREEKADYLIKFLNAYEPFRLAQRFIAIMFVSVYLLAFLIIFCMCIYAYFVSNIQFSDSLDSLFGLMKLINEYLGTPVALIVGFYFAGGTINSFKNFRNHNYRNNS